MPDDEVFSVTNPETGERIWVRGDRNNPPPDEELDKLFDQQRRRNVFPEANRPKGEPAVRPGRIPSPVGSEVVEFDRPLGVMEEIAGRGLNKATDLGTDYAPVIGGIVGGTAGLAGGLPGAIAGGAAGQASGEGLRRWIRQSQGREPDVPLSEDLTAVGKQGLIGGAGALVPPALRAGARALYAGPLKRAAPELFEQFGPDLVRRGLKEGIPQTFGGVRRAAGIAAGQQAERGAADVAAAAARREAADIGAKVATKGTPIRGPKGRMQAGPMQIDPALAGEAGEAATRAGAQEAASARLAGEAAEAENLTKAIRAAVQNRPSGADVVSTLLSMGLGGGAYAGGGGLPGALALSTLGLGARKAASSPAAKSVAALALNKLAPAGIGVPQAVNYYKALLRALGKDEEEPKKGGISIAGLE